MVDALKPSLRDSKPARWTALVIVSFTMLCGYYVADMANSVKPMLEQQLHWTSAEYGFFTGAYAWFNVFLFMLIFGGVILDKAGARFTGLLSCALMVLGCGAVWWAFTTHTLDHRILLGVRGPVMVASLGFAAFGVGIEIIGITATKVIARWFKGYEIALAMGLQVGTARIGTGLAIEGSAPLAKAYGNVGAPALLGVIMLLIGLVAYLFYCAMEKRLDASEAAENSAGADEEAFRLADIGAILRIRGFWYITILCALFYPAVFAFLKYAPDLMVQKFGVADKLAGGIPGILPFAAIPLTVIFGNYYDRKGKGASLMLLGSFLLVIVFVLFSLPFLKSWPVALLATLVLGFAFALVPAAMWPSVPRFIPHRQLGSAYAVIFWLQNLVALWGVPYLIGWVLDRYCVVGTRVVDGASSPAYDYTLPMLIFLACGVLAVVFALLLKHENKRMGYGLEEPCQDS